MSFTRHNKNISNNIILDKKNNIKSSNNNTDYHDINIYDIIKKHKLHKTKHQQ